MPLYNWGCIFGDEQYTDTFKAIVKKSFEKTQSPMIVGELISTLAELDIFQANNGALCILDAASDDGNTLEKIISHSKNVHNINLYAIDYKKEAVEKFRARFGDVNINNSRVKLVNAIVGNAFSGNLTENLRIGKNEINAVIVSHLIYGVDKSEVGILIKDIRENVLSEEGVAILLHVKDGTDSHVYFRNKYGSRAESDISASEHKIGDPASAIRDAVINLGGKTREIEYATRTYFDEITDGDWEEIKDPANFKRLSSKNKILDNILRLSFIPLRTPQDMAVDSTGRTWSAYVDEVKRIVQFNLKDKKGCYLDDVIALQVITPRNSTDSLEKNIDRALNLISNNLQEINLRAEREFFSKFDL